MPAYIALLRGVNLGGNKMVPMADLRALVESLGFDDVRTLLQSGNVVFRGGKRSPAALEALLEKSMAKEIGVSCDVHVRTAPELREAMERNPFIDDAEREPSKFLVSFFKADVDVARAKELQAQIVGRERVQCHGRHLYMVFPDGIGNSRLNAIVDRVLKAHGTARNWNTVRKLAALVGE